VLFGVVSGGVLRRGLLGWLGSSLLGLVVFVVHDKEARRGTVCAGDDLAELVSGIVDKINSLVVLVRGDGRALALEDLLMFMGSEIPEVIRMVTWSTMDVSQRRMRTGLPVYSLKNCRAFL
jgi:hypothetical protein